MRIISNALLGFALLSATAVAQVTPCLDSFGQSNGFLSGTTMGGPNLSLGIRLQNGATPILIDVAEIFSGGRGGPSAIAIWSHDPVNNVPLASLGSGQFTLSSVLGWQGARLTSPVVLQANEDFWLVWEPVNGCQISAEQRNRSGQPYRGSFDGGRSWNGPFQQYDWKFRLWCGGYLPGGFDIFGRSCPGTGRTSPAIGGTAIPRVGTSFDITLSRALANTTAILGLGASDSIWGGQIRLPFALDPVGAPGCSVFVDLLATAGLPTDATGAASFPLTVANDPALVGVTVFGQWLVNDTAANSLGLVTSDAARVTLGS